jgi:hypothetical protein
LDEVQSDYSQAHQQSTDDTKSESARFGGSVQKAKMTKKDLAAFMKEKLAQTKISSTVTT